MKTKDILFLCQFFYPEHNSSATLPFDTAAYLAKKGFSVGALCGYPKEYTDEQDVPLKEIVQNVDIQRVRYFESSRRSFIGRILNYFSFTVGALFHVYKLRAYKAVIVYSNPPVLPCVAILANLLFSTKIVFVSYDVYPEVAYASRTLKPGCMIDRVMKWINALLFKRTAMVISLTDEMKNFLLEHRPQLDSTRVVTIPNWAHESKGTVSPEAYQHFGYKNGQFIVSYFGNMGICQEMETLLDTIRLTKDNPEIQYLIVGHGSKKDRVKEIMKVSPNVKVLDFLVGKEFQQAVSISSVSVVSLEKGLLGTCAPSKYYSYLQGGQPVIAIVEKESYLAQEVQKENIGKYIEIGHSQELADELLYLQAHPEQVQRMGKNAENLYTRQYGIEIGLSKYAQVMHELLEP